ncbi:NADH-dependent butanol dehydrogenase a [Vibrio parahaemolyticus AQ3810]|uniref:iron-containing alcohol dehydrogenase n=2 Tax=Vibrio parahaemolyticus TaxID=670 RepID=UPI0001564A53|nr:iron-containing alcohol dehydrogenase [Vibrio parahaemolyticus]EDM61544.1 NADH-dependent butanol dehydrogenase a [Vibrio parahaemolyticus AQ3810]EFO44478.1 NADH-dependent butanol dehydrogenase A [Vibrio parahaemolyticus AQ4037]AOV91873.1 NADH-dependent butanol dehydrogenase a [Vibrio parahaemolyticus]EJG1926104.1 iron-containing alcohol dehydrogenase [Vibrio parahaemolyticus]EJL6385172.1 iron-containing alcohol dehydrogenase [Vibrio parahaemolyticus]
MQLDFSYYNPTTIHFGKDSLSKLNDELPNYGDTVLLVYGRNAIKSNGIYDKVMASLSAAGKKVVELSGVMPNPTYDKMMEGVQLVREHNVNLILAVGGGSVVDCAKGISVSAHCEGQDPFQKYWVEWQDLANDVVPVASILTMVGTGSEMNGGSVITHEETKFKAGRVFPPAAYPKFSILNPEYTFTVSQYQMVSGVFDTMSHLMEQYFTDQGANTTDYVIESLLKSSIDNLRVALKTPDDYEARSNIMWNATLALNTITGLSKTQDWQVHMIEHQVGAYTDCAHGMGLAAVSLPYYRLIYKFGLDKFVRFATQVWGVSTEGKTKEQIALEGIDALEAFTKECGIVTSLEELGATKEMLPKIAESTIIIGNGYKKLTNEDVLNILEECF